MGVVRGVVSDFLIVRFEFCVPKLVSVPIFSLIERGRGGIGLGEGDVPSAKKWRRCALSILRHNTSQAIANGVG